MRALGGIGAGLGHAPRLVIVAACLVVGLMYCTNSDMGGDPRSPRGDGRYRPVLARGDGHLLYLMARSLVFDQDLVFDNDLARFGDPFSQPRTQTGRKGIPHPIGPALVWSPLLAAAHGGAVVANAGGADIQMHGYTIWHHRIVFASSVVFGCLAAILGVWAFRRRVGGTWAPAWAGAAVLLGTSVTYYATYMPSYGHAMDAAGAGLFLAVWAVTFGELRWRRWIGLGGLLGLASLIRSQELGLGIVVVVEVLAIGWVAPAGEAKPWSWRARLIARATTVLVVALIVLIPQFIAWELVYGTWTGLPQGPNFTRPAHPMVAELLFSSRNGWFSTTPIAYAGVLGLVIMAVAGTRLGPRARVVAIGLLAAVAIQVYANSIVHDWWSSASFGQRRLCSMTMPLVVGLAAWMYVLGRAVARWRRVPRVVWHGVAVLMLGWFVAWNLGWVTNFKRGRAPERRAGPICCRGVPGPMAAVAQPIYRAIGNPFALPASAMLWLRHGLHPQRWDHVVGDYPWVPATDYTRASIAGKGASWDLGGNGAGPYVIRGLGPPQSGPGRAIRWTTAPVAEILVPNLLPTPQRLSLWVAPNAPAGGAPVDLVVRWNGDVVARASLTAVPATHAIEWNIEGDVGLNVLRVEASLQPPVGVAGQWTPGAPAGIAIGALRFTGI